MEQKLKHCTSSVFIFHKFEKEWKLVLVHHKKFDRWMVPGGHVEQNENPVEAALREAYEETSLCPKLISFIHKEFEKTDSKWLLPPEYFFEQRIPASKKEEEHFHLDCAYVSISERNNVQYREKESHDIQWFSEGELKKEPSVFLATQKIALIFFKMLKEGEVKDIATYIAE